jgi:hypothetical protein
MNISQPMSLEEAINDPNDYQDLEILSKIINNFQIYNEDLTEISHEVLHEFENHYQFLTIINNESLRRYLVYKNKLEEYIKEYNEKYKKTKHDLLKEFIKNNEITEISVGDEYGYCVDSYDRDAKIVIVTDEQKEFNQTKISYFKLIHEEFK